MEGDIVIDGGSKPLGSASLRDDLISDQAEDIRPCVAGQSVQPRAVDAAAKSQTAPRGEVGARPKALTPHMNETAKSPV